MSTGTGLTHVTHMKAVGVLGKGNLDQATLELSELIAWSDSRTFANASKNADAQFMQRSLEIIEDRAKQVAERLGNLDSMSKSNRLQLGALVRHLGRTKTQRTKTGTGPDIDLGPTHEWHLVMRNCLAAFGVSSHFLVSSIGRRALASAFSALVQIGLDDWQHD